MEPSNWAPGHSDALRELLARGMSFSEAARAINEKFGTRYTRSAAIGRGKRMGLVAPDRVESPPIVPPLPNGPRLVRPPKTAPLDLVRPPMAAFRRAEPVKLRCVGLSPRLLSLDELEPGDCRYPYGGDRDGEAIAFCGHPKRQGSSYCAAHFDLTRGLGTASERAARPVVLRLVTSA
ncbi:MAG: hypothetical protein HY852_05890 [Bradyrhizobium sp.]|uniref:GcrA family cell cycle regulator n=1 Tax=Bradyrhizobium sp. TaxID=376 RepID=UPI0025C2446F|nr:GcrA family cell cycle regulator [Bradyrhizobium sp.]MBI5261335.1 hypothetical protein [Bradyrhizobium sp.]